MKYTLVKGMLCMAVAAGALSACSDDTSPFGGGGATGKLIPAVHLDSSVNPDAAKSRAESKAMEISTDLLEITVTPSFASGTPYSCTGVSAFDTSKEFVVGKYLLEAAYGDVNDEGFEKPAYYGKQDIVVKDGEATPVTLTATLANAMVAVKYTDAFTGYMADWSAAVNAVEYGPDEQRPVYVAPGSVNLKVSVTKPNGLSATFALDPVLTEARHLYTVTVDVNNGAAGDAQLVVTFSDDMDTEEIVIDLSDKLLSTPAPEIAPKGFSDSTPIDILAGTLPDNTLEMNLIALAGLKEVNLTTTSDALIKQGWPAQIDLMAADAITQDKLTALGLSVVGMWKKPGEMAVIDFTNVPLHFSGTEEVEFSVIVKDKLLRQSEASVLKFNVEKAQLELVSADRFYEAGNPFNIVVGFNGAQSVVKDEITIQYRHPVSGMWTDLVTSSVSEGRSRAMLDYTVTVTAPNSTSILSIRARYQNTYSNELTVDPYTVTVNDNDVFATYAFVSIVGVNNGTNVTISVTKDGEGASEHSAQVENNIVKLSGLDPDSHYTVEVTPDDMDAKTVEFTTEKVAQLENGTFEDGWSATTTADWSKYTLTGWGTLNELTTSEGGSYGRNLLSQINNGKGAGYVAMSGTKDTDDASQGSKAALIQTVGWGSNNGTGFSGTIGLTRVTIPLKCENATAGELYLGHYDSGSKEAVYDGMECASRPSAMRFSYKYLPKNAADWGLAEIQVIGVDGSVIASKSFNITEQSDYTVKDLTLDYPLGTKKAAFVKIRFKSSDNADCLYTGTDEAQLKAYFDYPAATLDTKDGFIGSKLYVDDIQLIY